MTIEERAELGAELKRKCNCCQAALLALNDQTGLSDEQIMHLGSGFGSGMGNMEGTCGALLFFLTLILILNIYFILS